MQGYIPIEYPKWIDGVVVRAATEEQAYRAARAEVASVAREEEFARLPSPASIRMRRTRERRREGRLSIRCEISHVQSEALASAGLIDPVVRNDMTEVARGICRLLDRLTRSGKGARFLPQSAGVRGAHGGQRAPPRMGRSGWQAFGLSRALDSASGALPGAYASRWRSPNMARQSNTTTPAARELSMDELDQVAGGLVVIAIVAVLIGLLVPAVQTVCHG